MGNHGARPGERGLVGVRRQEHDGGAPAIAQRLRRADAVERAAQGDVHQRDVDLATGDRSDLRSSASAATITS